MSTLSDALEVASTFWKSRGKGTRTMILGATLCVNLLGGSRDAHKLQARDGAKLLGLLATRDLSRKSIKDYYASFRSMLRLNGVQTYDWPKAATPPRKPREALGEEALTRMVSWFHEHAFPETGDLATVLSSTGLRVSVELLKAGALRVDPGDSYDVIHVCGKGGHERIIPLVCPVARAILNSPERMAAMRRVPYDTHRWRWGKARVALGINSRLATPHSLRHKYATERLAMSGNNLVLVQELLGHASVGTTANYVTIPMDEKVKASGTG